ncbi:MAG: outer-membrane lipoprotein carrier protein LolA [Pseudomonadota bacterium]|nr:outer-membrane lipoprotein carrier protein LolA [Pseudomonadota bacterium]
MSKHLLFSARTALAVLVALTTCLAARAAQAEWNLPTLMQQLAQHPSGRAKFTETRTLAVLTEPVVSTGELVFSPPDRLEKHTLKPASESLVVSGNDLVVTQGGKQRALRLPQYPQVLAFVEALRGTLVGNQALLQAHYALALSGTESAWQLVLTPLDDQLRRQVSQITVHGARNQVLRVQTLQADGDKSLITIEPAAR